jgi:cytoplasmic iron level regulating protein YaaA (DUF328/UPF0246 family)
MITVISPAKRLNETPPKPEMVLTSPLFEAEARQLAKIARGLSADDLSRMMDISPALGALNHARFQTFGTDDARFAAGFLFDGDTYAGLDAPSLPTDALRWADGHLRILSGLYGLLAPRDGIQPYRLEMGTRLHSPKGETLYAFWGDKLAKAINALAQAQASAALINCASVEYFSAVDQKALRLPVITPVFLEVDDGHARTFSFWAKRARGAMARYICDGHITDPNDLRGFDLGGYQYQRHSSQNGKMVFARPYQPVQGAKAA